MSNEALMSARFNDFALLQDEDDVGIAHSAEAMGNNERRSPYHQLVQRLLHEALAALRCGDPLSSTYRPVSRQGGQYLSVSRADVASSRRRILGFLRTARAMATR